MAEFSEDYVREILAQLIDAFVCDNGDGDKVTILMPPEMRQWQFVNITVDDARVLSAKLTRAANLAEKNRPDEDIPF